MGNKVSFSAITNFDNISPRIQRHLAKVYVTLAGMLVFATLGVMSDVAYHIGGILTFVGVLALIFMLAYTAPPPESFLPVRQQRTEGKTGDDSKPLVDENSNQTSLELRLAMLAALGFLEGACIGPLVELVASIDPSIISSTVAGSLGVFAAFSASALLMKRRSMLFMGGFLLSGLSTLVWMSLLNMLLGSVFLFNINVYGGLLLFSGFVIFDTQLIVERADAGDTDFVMHALSLFLDFINIFVRMLIIAAKNSKK